MEFLKKIYRFIKKTVFRLWTLVEACLFLRLLLRFLGANPLTPVVHFIYKYTYFLIIPFENIFPNKVWWGRVIEISTICAMIGYGLLVFAASRICSLFFKE